MLYAELIKIILTYCGEREILMFHEVYPSLLKEIIVTTDNIEYIKAKYYKYIKVFRVQRKKR